MAFDANKVTYKRMVSIKHVYVYVKALHHHRVFINYKLNILPITKNFTQYCSYSIC